MSEEMGSDAYMQPIHAANAGSNQTADVGPEALCRLDLNLLVAFDAMARERSVTAAAARVGVTQSAMSHALRRLRVLFDDPLLVRGQSGMLLTPRAEALVVPLRSGLVTLGRALSTPQRFDPHTA
ncbi:MAG: LysR family transcriptional regulator, partial [Polyangiales bacterium]